MGVKIELPSTTIGYVTLRGPQDAFGFAETTLKSFWTNVPSRKKGALLWPEEALNEIRQCMADIIVHAGGPHDTDLQNYLIQLSVCFPHLKVFFPPLMQPRVVGRGQLGTTVLRS